MAYSKVLIFNHFGSQIAELDGVASVREYVINDEGVCTFTLALSDPGFSAANIQYGNLVFIQHVPSLNQDGTFNGQLPDWVGIIDTPRTWNLDNTVTITAYSAEHLLKKRPLPYIQYQGTFNDVALAMLGDANALGGLKVLPGNIGLGSDFTFVAGTAASTRTKGKQGLKQRTNPPRITINAKTSMYDHMKEAVVAAGSDWDISAQINAQGVLQLYLNTYNPKGYYSGMGFDLSNLKLAQPVLVEQGNIYNFVNGYGASKAGSTRASDLGENDKASIGDYNVWGENIVAQVTGQDAVNAATQQELSLRSRPVYVFKFVALDVGQTFANLDLGSVWVATLPNVGFTRGALGAVFTVRATGIRYSELDATNASAEVTSVVWVEAPVNG